ncbi:MAG: 3'-5' exonuclease [Gammaproteobacteria bacterium]|jgi:DNA polymerase III subunit epsilon
MKDCIEQLEASGDYRVIARLQPRDTYHEEAAVEKKIGIYLDTETTGFDPATDKVIELAMVPFEYDDAGRIYRVLPAYNGLADPGFPIPPVVTKVTGITDDLVKGQSLDLEAVKACLANAEIVIAHNASFDRPFCEQLLADFENVAWGCSQRDINWNEEGFEGVKLEYLAYKFGFFYDGHRATVDCQAGIELLSRQLPGSGEFVLKRLLDTASINLVRLWAKGAPFDKKDSLKQRGYRWNTGDDGQPKAWYTDIPQATLDAEMAYLNEHIYPRAIWILPTRVLDANIRYSKRI